MSYDDERTRRRKICGSSADTSHLRIGEKVVMHISVPGRVFARAPHHGMIGEIIALTHDDGTHFYHMPVIRFDAYENIRIDLTETRMCNPAHTIRIEDSEAYVRHVVETIAELKLIKEHEALDYKDALYLEELGLRLEVLRRRPTINS